MRRNGGEEAKKGPYTARGEPPEWQIIKKEKGYRPRNWAKIPGRHGSQGYSLQRDAHNIWVVTELMAGDCKKKRGFFQNGRIQCRDGTGGCRK